MNEKFKYIVISRRTWVAALIVAAAVILSSLTAASVSRTVTTSGETRRLPIYSVDRGEEKIIALSFDAAWDNIILRYMY